MKRALIVGGAFAAVLLLLVALGVVIARRALEQHATAAATSPAITPSPATEEAAAHPGSLYGRITTTGGDTYEGWLRWGGGQEAFWGDYFNGTKKQNPWAVHVAADRLLESRPPLKILGLDFPQKRRQRDLDRRFMARFGDIARIESRGVDVVHVTLKSGTGFELKRLDASDFDDGVRVWDGKRGVVDLDSLQIRAIELVPAAEAGTTSDRLHGTVRTRQGDFTGFVQWDRDEGVGSDELDGRSADTDHSVRFDTIRSIARQGDSSRVTLLDGSEIVLSGTNDVNPDNRGLYVDDPRYGRVLISWDAFERVDFSPGGGGPAYGDFPPGRPLTGSVTTRDGRRLAGRLVYDLDESETTETFDAPVQGVDYTIPFGLIASIGPPHDAGSPAWGSSLSIVRKVTLHGGEELRLERAGDLGETNAGMLIFVDGRPSPEYVPWNDVAQVDFDRPPAMYPPLDGR